MTKPAQDPDDDDDTPILSLAEFGELFKAALTELEQEARQRADDKAEKADQDDDERRIGRKQEN